jgi:c-di-GMP-binding flagellar brake protein YcgR
MNRRDVSRLQRDARREPNRIDESHSHRKSERRAHRRYSIQTDLEYRITKSHKTVQTGCGQTIDISTGGILFEAAMALPIGLKVEVNIAWPTNPDGHQPLELHAEGYTVRAAQNRTAVYIKRYAFREQQAR